MKIWHSYLTCVTLAVFALLVLTSCGDIEQNLKLNADGSGTLETTFDVGEMMGMAKGFDDIGSEDVTISTDQEPDTSMVTPEEPKDPMQLIIDKVTDPLYDRDFDTLMSLLSIMPDSVKEKDTRPDLAKKLSLRLKSPALSSDLTIGLVMNFDNPAQLKELIAYMETIDNASTTSVMSNAGPGGLQPESFLMYEADFKAGWIRIDSVDYTTMASEMGMSPDSLMSSEDMGMVEMMFGSTKIKSVIQVPGEVTSCTYKDAILTKDNKVIIEYGFMDAIKKGKVEGYIIYFNPKK